MALDGFHKEERLNLNKTGVYCITHNSKPDFIYIGSASSQNKIKYNEIGFLQRWRVHVMDLKNKKHCNVILQNTVNKYGIGGISFKIIKFCNPENCIEEENIQMQNFKKDFNLYNINTAHPTRLNSKLSDITKQKIREKQLKNKKAINQYDLNNNLIKTWDCIHSISKEMSTSHLYRCLKDESKTYKNSRWSYGTLKTKYKFSNTNNNKIVCKYNLDGEFLEEYDNCKIAGKETKISSVAIFKCCSGIFNTAKGFKWKYK